MLWLTIIDTCQNKVSANQYHMIISGLKAHRGQLFFLFLILFKLTADQVVVFNWISGSSQVNLL